MFRLRAQLISQRQIADAFAGGSKDCIDERGREWRNARLAYAARRDLDRCGDDMRAHVHRAFADPQHLIVMEVVLLHTPVLESHLRVLGDAQPHYRGAFDLGTNALRIHDEAGVDRRIHTWHRHVALIVYCNFDHRRDIGEEAALYSDAQPVTLRQLAPPAGFLGGELDYATGAGGIDRIRIPRISIVPQLVGHGLARINDTRRADHLEQELLLILAQLGSQLPNHRLHGERVRNIVYRTEPADTGMRRGLTGFQAQVRHVERRVDQAQSQLERAFAMRIRHEVGHQRWCDAAMTPRYDLAVLDTGGDVLVRHRVVEGMLDVIFTSPDD